MYADFEDAEEEEDHELFSAEEPTKILDRAYQKVSPAECAEAQSHLSAGERQKLQQVLEKHDDVFGVKLGCYPHDKINMRLKPGARPVHKRPCPVPYLREETYKRESQYLIREGVLRPCGVTDLRSLFPIKMIEYDGSATFANSMIQSSVHNILSQGSTRLCSSRRDTSISQKSIFHDVLLF